jgi:hypothetical protein
MDIDLPEPEHVILKVESVKKVSPPSLTTKPISVSNTMPIVVKVIAKPPKSSLSQLITPSMSKPNEIIDDIEIEGKNLIFFKYFYSVPLNFQTLNI